MIKVACEACGCIIALVQAGMSQYCGRLAEGASRNMNGLKNTGAIVTWSHTQSQLKAASPACAARQRTLCKSAPDAEMFCSVRRQLCALKALKHPTLETMCCCITSAEAADRCIKSAQAELMRAPSEGPATALFVAGLLASSRLLSLSLDCNPDQSRQRLRLGPSQDRQDQTHPGPCPGASQRASSGRNPPPPGAVVSCGCDLPWGDRPP